MVEECKELAESFISKEIEKNEGQETSKKRRSRLPKARWTLGRKMVPPFDYDRAKSGGS